MVTFFGAAMVLCFYNIGGWASPLKQLIYGCTWLFVCVLIFWTVITGWETKHHRVAFFGRSYDENDAQSTADKHRSARAATAVQHSSEKLWHRRLKKYASEASRKLTSRGMTLQGIFTRKPSSVS